MNIVRLLLARIGKLRKILMFVNIAMITFQCMFLFEMLGRLLANTICLLWVGSYSYILIKSLAFDHEFQDVAFLHLKTLNKIKAKAFILHYNN